MLLVLRGDTGREKQPREDWKEAEIRKRGSREEVGDGRKIYGTSATSTLSPGLTWSLLCPGKERIHSP